MSGITLKDIYDVVNRLEDKVDDRFSNIESDVEIVKTRVSSVEKLFSNMAGKVAIGVLIVGTFVGVLSDMFINFFKNLKS